jgi:hypothetical protein
MRKCACVLCTDLYPVHVVYGFAKNHRFRLQTLLLATSNVVQSQLCHVNEIAFLDLEARFFLNLTCRGALE